MNLAALRTDSTKESEGVWVELDPTASVKVRYTDTIAFNRAARAKNKPFRNVLRATKDFDEAIPAATREKISIDLIVDEVLLDWKGIFDGKSEVTYSKDAARELLKVRAFRDMVEIAAADLSNFRADDVKADAGNSEPVSDGS